MLFHLLGKPGIGLLRPFAELVFFGGTGGHALLEIPLHEVKEVARLGRREFVFGVLLLIGEVQQRARKFLSALSDHGRRAKHVPRAVHAKIHARRAPHGDGVFLMPETRPVTHRDARHTSPPIILGQPHAGLGEVAEAAADLSGDVQTERAS